ncbi:MAG TPA: hypothetical protein VF721_09185 [Pyrinomonadaceae bacterium]|jgi:hypothetical protein
MKSNRIVKLLFAVLFLTFCGEFSASAQVPQTNEEREVPVIKKFGSGYFECTQKKNSVIDEEKFKEILLDKECSSLEKTLKVDFTKHTLITFGVGGDCFVRAAAKVFRNDAAKKYNVRIKQIRGGCRAAGSYQGWLLIEKIPAGYAVEFTVTRADGRDESGDAAFWFSPSKRSPKEKSAETLETRPIDLKGCIQTIFNTQFVIKDNETYLKTIRNDASREWCLKNLEKIDFSKHTLLGKSINSGYCRRPEGLEYKAVKDAAAKQYLLSISYDDTRGTVCRALSQYDLWLLVPKLPADYEVKFEVKAR